MTLSELNYQIESVVVNYEVIQRRLTQGPRGKLSLLPSEVAGISFVITPPVQMIYRHSSFELLLDAPISDWQELRLKYNSVWTALDSWYRKDRTISLFELFSFRNRKTVPNLKDAESDLDFARKALDLYQKKAIGFKHWGPVKTVITRRCNILRDAFPPEKREYGRSYEKEEEAFLVNWVREQDHKTLIEPILTEIKDEFEHTIRPLWNDFLDLAQDYVVQAQPRRKKQESQKISSLDERLQLENHLTDQQLEVLSLEHSLNLAELEHRILDLREKQHKERLQTRDRQHATVSAQLDRVQTTIISLSNNHKIKADNLGQLKRKLHYIETENLELDLQIQELL